MHPKPVNKENPKLIFSLDGHPYIELNKLLKLMAVVQSGGEAKMVIREGLVHVNEEEEHRLRRKLVSNDHVSFENISITIKE